MCGIVGYIGDQEASPILIESLRKLEYRGYDSAGIAVYNGSSINIVKTKGRLKDLEEKLEGRTVKGTVGIGHTRWATHGAPSDENSHPHTNGDESITVVHNGIIENYMELKDELISHGYVFVSETDTEVAVHLIDYYYKHKEDPVDAVVKAMNKIEGSYALGVLFKDHPDLLIAVRKDSPLIVGLGKGENYIASDIPAVLQYTRDVYLLEDEEIAILTKEDVKIINKNKEQVNREVFKVTWDVAAAEKGGYDHFMLKEIFEQAKVVKDTLMPRLPENQNRVVLDEIKLSKDELDNINKIYIVACGTAYYAGLVGKYLIERITRVPVVAEVASEFRYRDPVIDENTLMIVISQSGETADTLAALRLAKQRGARVLGVVNVVGSSIAREADDILYTWAGPEIAVASTKAYSAQLAAMYLLTCHIALELGKMTEDEFVSLRDELYQLPRKVNRVLSKAEKIKRLADKYVHSKNVFYVGRGLDYMVSMEGSLKLKEIAYVHSEPYAAGELKHGPIALIEDATLVIGIVTQEDLYEKTVSNLKEIKARDGKVLAIAVKGNTEIEKVVDDVIYIPQTHWMFTSLLANIPQQLFAYYVSTALGHDVDKPRNLAKSVTVE
ncbi:glutamine--fructose-6-phosphate transaminase (isomerizing) [Defluviitalea raffinosedens]|uniref:Glutamine--fructose-6-phosphate aminotransferase [isomerizing] n=1 Tax=Defluviitalea raffinosedens TaxID=1450156 RepID=A0A7C8HGW4_9FIRM|nr:glutamine--fructose-6-phosphate transaminase (isomerizing) [Defluviitalea raffinosedens]KAE9636229.1 glutamine--fructose-6-phosphate transaminase (isomerizing) [Defluviitalea raffinosedens]MBM7684910.1 glucosamine--fructose-6-phosphate aminotransferase (isomerizing) [Defluviitalea raffinosedens]HHW66209.1 glutamine--fructose-6-phosphate transaminase (isomerizing) [Candidatus Epulonipiscium sp.]